MGKVKIKKSDTFIDMTPMSDVMTLLLTFFMLTSTFVKSEPVKVNTPGSVSETKVPENGVLTIIVSPEKTAAGTPTGNGQVFMSYDNTNQLAQIVDNMTTLTPAQKKSLCSRINIRYSFGQTPRILNATCCKTYNRTSKNGYST